MGVVGVRGITGPIGDARFPFIYSNTNPLTIDLRPDVITNYTTYFTTARINGTAIQISVYGHPATPVYLFIKCANVVADGYATVYVSGEHKAIIAPTTIQGTTQDSLILVWNIDGTVKLY